MKTILITGATKSVGRATAEALAQQGYRLLLHGRNARACVPSPPSTPPAADWLNHSSDNRRG